MCEGFAVGCEGAVRPEYREGTRNTNTAKNKKTKIEIKIRWSFTICLLSSNLFSDYKKIQ